MRVVAAPTPAQQGAADPGWATIAIGAVVTAVWVRRLDRQTAITAAKHALLGVIAAAVVALAIRAIVGPHLPAFIPPEESAAPGLVLSLDAGLCEELLFRLGVRAAMMARS